MPTYLQTSGPISLNDIDNVFGYGTSISAYRNAIWYKENNTNGTFSSSNLDFAEFYGTGPEAPVPPLAVSYVYNTYSTTDSLSYTFTNVSFGTSTGVRRVAITVFANNSGNNNSDITSATIAGIPASLDVNQSIFGNGRPRTAVISAAVPEGTTSGTVTINYQYGAGGCSIGVYNITGATYVDASAWSGIGADVTTQTAPLGAYISGYPRAVIAVAGTLDSSTANMSFSGAFTGRDYQNSWGDRVTGAGKGGVINSMSDVTVSYGITANWARVVAVAYA